VTDAPLDSLDLFGAVAATPSAVRQTLVAADATDLPQPDISAVVLVGVASSRLLAVAIEAVVAPLLDCPIVSVVGGALPGWAGAQTLVIALDNESAEAMLSDPRAGSVHLISVGAVAPLVRRSTVVELAGALAALEGLGLVRGIVDQMIAAIAQLEVRCSELSAPRSVAFKMARRIGRTMPIIYGVGEIGAAATASWKASINCNAKAPAFANVIPGLDHDEVCGWAQHGDVTRQVFTLVTLGHGGESAEDGRRLAITTEICDEIVGAVLEVEAVGSSPVARLFDLMVLGEYVSLEMAQAADIDPGPVPILALYEV